ncbi:MAG: class I SAM-dependent methyltransferase [Novosphingobium sp.]|nr:class I SAM-dependent methyltransferase [Novosphingobium sp.]
MNTQQNYLAWAQSSKKSGIGRALKRWVEKTYLSAICDALGERAGAPASVSLLEIGPGNGEFAHEAISFGFSYSAIERSPVLAQELRERGIDCIHSAFPGRVEELSGRQFDCIYLSHVLEHQDTRQEAVDFIAAVAELLAPGGICVINCPNVLSHGLLFWNSDYTHNFITTPLRVRNLLIDQGFDIVLERRMRFGFWSWLPRGIVAVCGSLVRPWMLAPVARLFIKGYPNDPRIFFRENFTVIARRS